MPDVKATTSTPTLPPAQHAGHWKKVIAMLLPALVFQMMFLACACEYGEKKMNAALAADAVIVVRAVVGLLTGGDSRWSMFYAVLYFLVIPITLLFASLAGAH